jgi:hypothetical protein
MSCAERTDATEHCVGQLQTVTALLTKTAPIGCAKVQQNGRNTIAAALPAA